MTRIYYGLLLIFWTIFLPFQASRPTWAAESEPLLEDIVFDAPSPSEERITFKLNGTYLPKIFSIKGEKPRVVFDFPHTKAAAMLNNIIDTNGKIIKRIRIGIHEGSPPKTRVVLDLEPNQPVDFQQDFNEKKQTLVVSVQHTGASADSEASELKQTEPEEKIPDASSADAKKNNVAPTVAASGESAPSAAPNNADVSSQPAVTADQQPADTQVTNSEATKSEVKNSAERATKPAAPTTPAAPPSPPTLSAITFDPKSNRGEMILFKLNEFYPPIVFGVEESSPRVVCDFMDTSADPTVPSQIKCDGKYVRNIRVGRHKNPNKIRVVLDLTPNNNYDLQQVFFKEDNLFVIIINTLNEGVKKN